MTVSRRALVHFAAIFAGWTAFGLLTATQTQLQLAVRGETRAAWSVLGPSLIGAWLWALYTPPLVIFARWLRRVRERAEPQWRGWAVWFGAHLGVAAVGTVADAVVWAQVRPLIDGVSVPVERVFAAVLLMNVFCYVAVVTITEAVDFAGRWRERDRAATALAHTADTLRRQLDDARLRALESQLRPHFLYNTLNLAAELVYDEPEVADDMLTDLGMLLRRSYSDSPQLVPLGDEMRFVRAYTAILARRYRDRVHLTIAVPPELEPQMVPAFLLQPLVENAFRHGVERRERTSAVEVEAGSDGASLLVRVRDRGLAGVKKRADDDAIDAAAFAAAFDAAYEAATLPDSTDRPREGIGIRNTRERLKLLYGEAAGLALVRSSNETVASVWVPIAIGTRDAIGTSGRGTSGLGGWRGGAESLVPSPESRTPSSESRVPSPAPVGAGDAGAAVRVGEAG